MVSVQMHADEASGRVHWLDVACVVFLLDSQNERNMVSHMVYAVCRGHGLN